MLHKISVHKLYLSHEDKEVAFDKFTASIMCAKVMSKARITNNREIITQNSEKGVETMGKIT